MNISVVIPNWNGESQLKKNLPFVVREKPFEIIIVDDASTDNSVDFLKKKYPQIKIICNSTNKNFAYTVNRGVEKARGELICILNTDVRPKPGFLKNAIKYFKDPTLFGVSLHEVGFGPSVEKFEDGFVGYKKGQENNTPQSTFWLSGGSSIIKKTYWDKLGGFDNLLFPYYWEDLDLSYRARKMGLKLLWVPDCTVEHRHETFYNQKYSLSFLNRQKELRQLIFIWKNLSADQLVAKHFPGLVRRVIKSPGYLRIFVMALPYLPLIIYRRLWRLQ